jgi:hypothetical protein
MVWNDIKMKAMERKCKSIKGTCHAEERKDIAWHGM